jgi:hypothetical protein
MFFKFCPQITIETDLWNRIQAKASNGVNGRKPVIVLRRLEETEHFTADVKAQLVSIYAALLGF